MSDLVAFVAALVVYRLTLLVTDDVLTKPIRERIFGRYIHPVHELSKIPRADTPTWDDDYPYTVVCRCGDRYVGQEWADVIAEANHHVNKHRGEQTHGPKWLTLLDCPWCASWWIGLPVAWSAWCFGDRSWWFIPAFGLAASGVSGFLATFAKPES